MISCGHLRISSFHEWERNIEPSNGEELLDQMSSHLLWTVFWHVIWK